MLSHAPYSIPLSLFLHSIFDLPFTLSHFPTSYAKNHVSPDLVAQRVKWKIIVADIKKRASPYGINLTQNPICHFATAQNPTGHATTSHRPCHDWYVP